MKKSLLFILVFSIVVFSNVCDDKVFANLPVSSMRIYNEQGEWVGTCRREDHVFNFYNLKERKIENPAEYMKKSENDCYLYNVEGFAIGKCTSSKVILFKF